MHIPISILNVCNRAILFGERMQSAIKYVNEYIIIV